MAGTHPKIWVFHLFMIFFFADGDVVQIPVIRWVAQVHYLKGRICSMFHMYMEVNVSKIVGTPNNHKSRNTYSHILNPLRNKQDRLITP